jgi:hypothetical protein
MLVQITLPGRPARIAFTVHLAHIPRMSDASRLDRRDFLHATTGVLTGLLAAGSPLASLAPTRAWALDLMALTTQEGATLFTAARTIAPHDKLEDAAYALVIRAIDTACAKDPALRKQYQEGIVRLGANFVSDSEEARVNALERIESTAFFQTLRVATLQTLYTTPMAYAYFGYEGEAFSKGGYLHRGFNDLRWLPEVPEADGGVVLGIS